MTRHRDVITAQTKTRQRVRDLAEVYTNEREVTAMLDMVADMFPSGADPRNIGRKFLEPACGAGNFLVAILERKLSYVTTSRYRSTAAFETAVLKSVSSVYGIDIDEANVAQSRDFLRAEIAHHANLQLNTVPVTAHFWGAVDRILETNVIRADTLKDARLINLVEYHWLRRTGYVQRRWSWLEEPVMAPQVSLFADDPPEPPADAMPIHYSELADNPNPTVNKPGRSTNR